MGSARNLPNAIIVSQTETHSYLAIELNKVVARSSRFAQIFKGRGVGIFVEELDELVVALLEDGVVLGEPLCHFLPGCSARGARRIELFKVPEALFRDVVLMLTWPPARRRTPGFPSLRISHLVP